MSDRKPVRRSTRLWVGLAVLLLLAVGAWYVAWGRVPAIGEYDAVGRAPRINPDYTDIVIPPNIAPLNFHVEEEASHYCVKVGDAKGGGFDVYTRAPDIAIPARRWRPLLAANRGGEIHFDVYARDKAGLWKRFDRVAVRVAKEDVDGFLAYRKIHPAHNGWWRMGIYQRDLSSYDEELVMDNQDFRSGCCHCHAFSNNRTDGMSICSRSPYYGSDTLLVTGESVQKIGAKLGFLAWRPANQIVACTVNEPKLLLHAGRNEIRDIVEMDSDILYWRVDSQTMNTCPQLAQQAWMETWPAWSPDGRYLYFCRARKLWTDMQEVPPERYREVKYDLARISYDAASDHWGEVETVLPAAETELSIGQPRISPDGRWLSFVMFPYSCWPVYHPESDAYLIDLRAAEETGKYECRRIEASSDQCDSWVSWSSNSRWVVIGSARGNILFNRPYLAYVDTDGKISKPFLPPQKDPDFYASCLDAYTMPELLIEPVRVTRRELAAALRGSEKIPVNMPARQNAEAYGRQ